MWEGVTKTKKQLQGDRVFVEKVRKSTHGNLELGAKRAMQLGWKFVAIKDPGMAIHRFNQAWLLDPDYPDIYWGFAVAMDEKGAPLSTVERFFAKAESMKPDDPDMLADHGRILQHRGEIDRAMAYFQRALDLDKSFRPAHFGMMLAMIAKGKHDVAEQHGRVALSSEAFPLSRDVSSYGKLDDGLYLITLLRRIEG
ncbi:MULTISPECIES: hypothetical protein [unclassified Ensifer]|uniref:tetratricopeptide repeat protein n=1 Tax=unclassified Ensifer TaxID=2633371 RepID=UPI0011122711|nr:MULTISPECIES: hypothetical protein [unclassified Ensifer]